MKNRLKKNLTAQIVATLSIGLASFLVLSAVTALAVDVPNNPNEPSNDAQNPTSKKPLPSDGGALVQGKVYFENLKDGQTVHSPFQVKMGVKGLKVRPAGESPDEMTSGHFHILIDTDMVATGQVIPADDKHLHFGKGQTETQVTLSPGKHTLILQFADGAHRAFSKHLTATVKVTVEK